MGSGGKNKLLYMQKSDLREVKFSLSPEMGYDPDLTEEEKKENEEQCRKRTGYFHQWVQIEVKSPQSGNYILETMGLIEEGDTGKVHTIPLDLITFKN